MSIGALILVLGIPASFILLGIAPLWFQKRLKIVEEDWNSNPTEAWRKMKIWKKGKVHGSFWNLTRPNTSNVSFTRFFLTIGLLIFLKELHRTPYGFQFVLGFLGLVLLAIFFGRLFVFTFEDAGRLGDCIKGHLKGPWELFYGKEINVTLVCIEVTSLSKYTYQGKIIYKQSLVFQAKSNIEIEFPIPMDIPPLNAHDSKGVMWYLIVPGISGKFYPVSFYIPVVQSAPPQQPPEADRSAR